MHWAVIKSKLSKLEVFDANKKEEQDRRMNIFVLAAAYVLSIDM